MSRGFRSWQFSQYEIRDRLDNPADFEQLQETVEMFTQLLPGLLINDAMFLMGVAGGQQITAP